MKKIATLITCILFSISMVAQIPNSSFDTWISKGTYEVPDRWGTMNNTTPADSVHTVEKGNPGNPSLYYIKIISRTIGNSVVNGIAVSGKLDTITMQPLSGFAYTGQPKSFTGIWEFMSLSGSAGSVSATLTKWNVATQQREVVAIAADTLGAMIMNFESFSIDFSYVSGNIPDSCIIVLKASGSNPGNGDYLFVDNLAFAGNAAGVQHYSGFINSIYVYPNPSVKNIMVDFSLNEPGTIKIQITDLSGKSVKEVDLGFVSGFNKYAINVDGIAKGTYFVNLISGKDTEAKKIVIE